MAFTPYHNIVGSTAQTKKLLDVGDVSRQKITTLNVSNINDMLPAVIDLYIFKSATSTTSSETYYIIKNHAIRGGDRLELSGDVLNFDNSANGYSLHIKVGSADKVDVMIKK